MNTVHHGTIEVTGVAGRAGEFMWGPPGIQISFVWGNQTVEASATVRDLQIMED